MTTTASTPTNGRTWDTVDSPVMTGEMTREMRKACATTRTAVASPVTAVSTI